MAEVKESVKGSADAQPEISFETMSDERSKKAQLDSNEVIQMNVKRTYDEYQEVSLDAVKRNARYVEKVLSDAQQYDNQRQAAANLALNNAIETANMVGKQAVRHSDLAIDRQWNVDEQGYTAADILESNTFKDAITGAVAVAVAEAFTKYSK